MGDRQSTEVVVVDSATGGVISRTPEPLPGVPLSGDISWAADGAQLAIQTVVIEGGAVRLVGTGWTVVDAQSGAVKHRFEATWAFDWSPDGERVAVVSSVAPDDPDHANDGVILVGKSDGEVAEVMDSPLEGVYFESVRWEP